MEVVLPSDKLIDFIWNNIRDVIFTLSKEGVILSLNREFENSTGWKREEWIGKPYLQLLHPDDRQVVIDRVQAYALGDPLPPYESRIKSKDGSYIVFEAKATPQTVNDQFNGLLGIARDITERKKMEEELRENEEKFRSIFEHAPIGMALVTFDFLFTQINTAFCEMLGYQEQELLPLTFLDVIHPEFIPRNEILMKKLVDGERLVIQIEQMLVKKNIDSFWARTTLSRLKGDKGAPYYYLAMIEDINALKKIEEDVRSQLLKFKIRDGNMYLIKEKSPHVSLSIFQDLLKIGYKGFIISRTHEREYRAGISQFIHESFDFFHLSAKIKFDLILEYINRAPDKSIFLIDRLEFIFSSKGFNTGMNEFVYNLGEIAYLKSLVILLSCDSSTLSEKEINILEKEVQQIEPIGGIILSEEFFEILRYLYQENSIGIKPTYSVIGEKFQISRPTTRKRIMHLVSRDYVVEHKIGKSKILEVSEKGKALFLTYEVNSSPIL